jgi:hypothetical protein
MVTVCMRMDNRGKRMKCESKNEEDAYILERMKKMIDWRVPSILHWVCSESSETTNDIPEAVCEADSSDTLRTLKSMDMDPYIVSHISMNQVFQEFGSLGYETCIQTLQKEMLIVFSPILEVADIQYREGIMKRIYSHGSDTPDIFIPKIVHQSTADNLAQIVERQGWGKVKSVDIKRSSKSNNKAFYAFIRMCHWNNTERAKKVRTSFFTGQSVVLAREDNGNFLMCKKFVGNDKDLLYSENDVCQLAHGIHLPSNLY